MARTLRSTFFAAALTLATATAAITGQAIIHPDAAQAGVVSKVKGAAKAVGGAVKTTAKGIGGAGKAVGGVGKEVGVRVGSGFKRTAIDVARSPVGKGVSKAAVAVAKSPVVKGVSNAAKAVVRNIRSR